MKAAAKKPLMTLQKNSSPVNNYIEQVQKASFEQKIPYRSNEDIQKKLLIIMSMIGISMQNVPTGNDKHILTSYMRKHLTNYSLSDMGIAFTLYVQGKLDFNESHHGKFSVLFLEKVMQSYKRYKVSLPNTPPPAQEINLLPEERETLNRNSALQCFDRYRQSGNLIDFGNIIYDWLDRRGHINLTDERKWQLWKQAKHNLKAEAGKKTLTYKNAGKLSEIINAIERKDEGVKAEAKRLALREYFDFLLTTVQELKEVIE